MDVRQVAGLLLKNTLRHAGAIPPSSVDYVKTQLLLTIGAADQGVRKTVGSAISTLLEGGGVAGWPEILEAMVRCLDSGDYNHMEGAMDALSKVGFRVKGSRCSFGAMTWRGCATCLTRVSHVCGIGLRGYAAAIGRGGTRAG